MAPRACIVGRAMSKIAGAAEDKFFSANNQRFFWINDSEKGEDRTKADYIRDILDAKNAVIEQAFYDPKGTLVLLIKRVGTCAECDEQCEYGNYLCGECKRNELERERAGSDQAH